MEFQVLGPMRVEDSGREFPLGGPKPRTMLALLVAAAGTPVSMDSLLMDVYGPDANPKARRTLHTYLSRYRASLGDVIQRQGDGYALNMEAMSIDAVQFEKSVRHAESLIDLSESVIVLRDALRLWRGHPYEDVESPSLENEARRLEELRAEAIEARVALDLGAGRHRELVAELEQLVARDPGREQLCAHRMLALYRCGRRVDALAAYRAHVDYLRDEHGLGPSPGLQRLEERILQQHDNLDYRPRARRRPPPARYTSFVGRDEELAAVEQLIEEHRLVTITGPGGVGKSSLAGEVARSFTDRMAVSFVPIEAERQEQPARLIAQSLGLQPTEDADMYHLIAASLGSTKLLLLLDGCEHMVGELPTVITEILHGSPEVRIVVTSREPLSITGDHRFALEPLPVGADSQATRLFIDRAAIPADELDDETSEIVARIAEGVSGLPLAIELAAARYRTMSLDEIADRLEDQTQLLATIRAPVPRQMSIVATLDWSYQLLDKHEQHTFRQLAVFTTGLIPTDAAKVVLANNAPAPVLQRLVELSLLSPTDAEVRFRILEPIRQYAEMQLDAAEERLAAERRHAQWLVTMAGELRHLFLMGYSAQALQRLRTQARAVAAAASWAVEHDQPGIVLDIVAAVGRLWPRVADPRTLRGPAIKVLEALQAPLKDREVAALANTAFLHRLDEPDVARDLASWLESESLHITDPATLAIVNSALAAIPYDATRLPKPDDVAVCFSRWQASVELLGVLGYPAEPQYRNGAVFLIDLGRRDEAEELLRSMAKFAGETRPVVRGLALELLAEFRTLRGEHAAALADLREAARLLIDGGDLDFAAEAESRRAWTHCLVGEFEAAEDAMRRSDEYHAAIGLKPVAEEDPLLTASIAAGLIHWDEFVPAIQRFFASAPVPSDRAEYEEFLIGDPTTAVHFVHMIEPLARWLISRGQRDDATALLAAAPMAYATTAFIAWEQVGDVARTRRLANELSTIGIADPPTSLDELCRYMMECVTED